MEQQGISKLDLKRRNRMQILRILKEKGPTSRIDIANELELTRAAVTIITTDMIEQGIIYELGEYQHTSARAPRGRKKILMDINYHYKFVLGVTIEENIISVGLSTLSGDVLDKRNLKINDKTTDQAIFDYIEVSLKQVLSDNCLERDSVLGIGFGVHPSMYSRMKTKVVDGVPDYSEAKAFVEKYTELPIVFETSIMGTALANIDFRKEPDPDCNNIGFIQYGNEIHFLSTYRNQPVETYYNRTEFVNKMIVDPDARDICPCGRRGCVENELTVKAVRREIDNTYSKDQTPFLYRETNGKVENITSELIMQAYRNGDKGVVNALNRALTLMGVLINNLNFFANPQKIILHLFYFESEIAFDIMKDGVEKIAGKDIADKLELSIISKNNRFLSGCAIAVRELFFDKGGFDV